MKRSAFLGAALLGALGGQPAWGQQPGRIYRVGLLIGRTLASNHQNFDAFRRSLSGLGYREGKNLEIIYRAADGHLSRLPELATGIVRAKPDVIVAVGPTVLAAKRATTSIPIVITEVTDPIGNGYIANLARPGGNITGMTNMDAALTGKRLQLLKELVPDLRRVAILQDPSNTGNLTVWRTAESVSRTLGVQVAAVDIRSIDQVDAALETIPHLHADAMLVQSGAATNSDPAGIVRFAAAHRLPTLYQVDTFSSAGGLIVYGASEVAMWSQMATYVDRILKGAKPADLPVEQPTTFELVVNLKTARSLGITVPQSILLRATQVIR